MTARKSVARSIIAAMVVAPLVGLTASVVGPAPAVHADPTVLPLAQWASSQSSGLTVFDETDNGHAGVISSSGGTPDVGWVAGNGGYALSFNGTSASNVKVGSSTDLTLTRTISVDLWVAFNSGAGTVTQTLLEKGPGSGTAIPYALQVDSSGNIGLYWANSWVDSTSSPPLTWLNGSPASPIWYHIQVIDDGSYITFIRDNQQVGRTADTQATITAGGGLYLGGGAGGLAHPLNGELQNVQLGVPTGVAPHIQSVSLSSSTLNNGTPEVITANVTGAWSNPDDPNVGNVFPAVGGGYIPADPGAVEATATVTTPSQQTQQVPGFLYQNFAVNSTAGTVLPSGAPVWTFRYTPRSTGTFSVQVTITTADGTMTSSAQTFTTTGPASGYQGFVRADISPGGAGYYQYGSSGKSFYSVGLNLNAPEMTDQNKLGVAETGLLDSYNTSTSPPTLTPHGQTAQTLYSTYLRYISDLDQLSEANGNTARVRVDSRFLPLELCSATENFSNCAPSTLLSYAPGIPWSFSIGRYNEANAWIVDQLVEQGRTNLNASGASAPIVLQLTAFNSNENWGSSCYAINSPTLPCPTDIVPPADITAGTLNANGRLDLLDRRLYYDEARWGYSPSVLSWEMFNESSEAGGSSGVWPTALAYLTALDINSHILTDSDPAGTTQTNATFGQEEIHSYWGSMSSLLNQTFAVDGTKPYVESEFGYNATDHSDPGAWAAHTAPWVALMQQMSGAWYWWTEEELNGVTGGYEQALTGISNFTASLNLAGYTWNLATLSASTGLKPFGMLNAAATQAILWITDPSCIRSCGTHTNTTVTISGLTNGKQYSVQWWDADSGTQIGSPQSFTGTTSQTLTIPSFTNDIAAHITPT